MLNDYIGFWGNLDRSGGFAKGLGCKFLFAKSPRLVPLGDAHTVGNAQTLELLVAHGPDRMVLLDLLLDRGEPRLGEAAVDLRTGGDVLKRLDANNTEELVEMQELGPLGTQAVISSDDLGQLVLTELTKDILHTQVFRASELAHFPPCLLEHRVSKMSHSLVQVAEK